eukprot:1379008-Amorphochlora_amoeboformis.AAC.1
MTVTVSEIKPPLSHVHDASSDDAFAQSTCSFFAIGKAMLGRGLDWLGGIDSNDALNGVSSSLS